MNLPTRRTIATALSLMLVATGCAAAQRDARDPWQQPERVVQDFGLKPGDTVADIGCGQGYFTFRVAQAVGEKGKVYATEISEKALKPVRDRVQKEGLANIEPVLSEPTQTKLPADALDAALLVNVVHHVPKDQRPALVKDIVRSIKPGGVLFLIDWRIDARIRHDMNLRIPRDELLALVKDTGLVLDAEYHYLVNQVFFRLRKPLESK